VPKTVPPTFASLYKKVASGVVRVNTTDCNRTSGIGTGFLLSPTVVATVDHVANDAGIGATTLSVAGSNDQTVSATVIGTAPNSDLALLQLSSALLGHIFTVTPSVPAIGTQVASLGFPNGGPLSFGEGTVQDLGQTQTIDLSGTALSLPNLMQTDIPAEPGDSGGPVVTLTGQVVGLIDDGTPSVSPPATYAVESSVAAADFSTWESTPSPQPLSSCTSPAAAAPPSTPPPSTTPPSPVSVVEEFYAAINAHDYASAWALGGDNLSGGGTYAEFVQGYSNTAYDTITSIYGAGDTVYMNLVATDDSGAQTSYSVTYTVRGEVIVSGSGTQTS
jgi:hypothetical protein